MQILKPIHMRILALGECALVLPATILLAAAAARWMQPLQYEPAHISWLIFEWTTTHISRSGAALLFLGLPAVAIVVGFSVLLSAWRNNQQLRTDVTDAWGGLRRQWSIALVSAATFVAAIIVALAAVHVLTD